MPSFGEEELREAACYNDIDAATKLLQAGVNVNSQHAINKRTALHWAVIRKHRCMVELLLSKGADASLPDSHGFLPTDWATSELRPILGCTQDSSRTPPSQELCITPNYLAYPPLNYTVNVDNRDATLVNPGASRNSNAEDEDSNRRLPTQEQHTTSSSSSNPSCNCPSNADNAKNENSSPAQLDRLAENSIVDDEELILKVRAANSDDADFIEIELPHSDLTYSNLLNACSRELEMDGNKIVKIRKLPDTIVRRDKEVARFRPYQKLEVVTED